ncbi:hypothetical protein HYS79_00200 [Patescibacteria group bacterium]|nr:hypothetical protein [Patescibacteria group bacterium]
MFNNPTMRFLSQTVLVLLLVSLIFTPTYEVAQAGPVALVIAAVVVIGAGAVAATDYFTCTINILWGCGGGKDGGGDSNTGVPLVEYKKGKPTPLQTDKVVEDGTPCYSLGNICGARNKGTMQGGVCTAVTPQDSICCSSAPNACGLVNYAPPGSAGSCADAQIDSPPNSLCEAPSISDTSASLSPNPGFYADPSLVRLNSITTLYWDVLNATACSLSGGGLNLPGLTPRNQANSNPITQATEFTLTCENGEGGPTASATARVTIIPVYQEI